jgi:hypothetical protein
MDQLNEGGRDGWMDRWIYGWIDGWMDDGWMDGRTDGWMDGWMKGLMDGWKILALTDIILSYFDKRQSHGHCVHCLKMTY